MNLKPYPKYKDSGVEWLGEIPEGWEVSYLKNIGRFSASGIDKKIVEGESLVRMVNYMDIYGNDTKLIDNERELMTVSCPEWKIAECNLIKGDLVFTPSSETSEDIGLSALITENLTNAVFSYHVVRFRFKKVFNHNFKRYICNNTFVLQQFTKASRGTTRQILDRSDFKNITVVIPPFEEQKRISTFLDQKTTKIDELIKKNEKLIELLKEKRQAIISHAVTKGLDSNVEMKDSGFEWIGEIPEGWSIRKLKFLASIKLSGVDKKTLDGELPIKLCNYTDVYKNEFIFEELDFMEATATENEIAQLTLNKGDVLITKDSETPDDIAVPAYVKSELRNVLCGYHLARIRANTKYVVGEYLFRLFCAPIIREQFTPLANGITRYGLGKYSIDNSIFPVPTIDEQKKISAYIDQKVSKIYELIKKIQSQIDKLKEYRQALISNVVTGKVRVAG